MCICQCRDNAHTTEDLWNIIHVWQNEWWFGNIDVSTHTNAHIRTRTRTYAHAHAHANTCRFDNWIEYTHTHTHTQTHTHMHTRTSTHSWCLINIYTSGNNRKFTYLYLHRRIHTNIYKFTRACTSAFLHLCIYRNIYTYVVYTHTRHILSLHVRINEYKYAYYLVHTHTTHTFSPQRWQIFQPQQFFPRFSPWALVLL